MANLFKKITLGFFVSFISAANASQLEFKSDIFFYEDPINAKRLHVSLKGDNWQAEDIKPEHTQFHVELFGNSTVMVGFADGQTRSSDSVSARVNDSVMNRFSEGKPHGLLTISDESDTPFMHAVAGAGDLPGTSEIAYAMIPGYWGKGYGKQVITTIVQKWAPEVYRIGRGTDLDSGAHANIIRAFQCFGGKPLDQLDATASPSNPASWKILDKIGFKAAKIGLTPEEDTVIDFSFREFASSKDMEAELVKFFDGNKLEAGKRYFMIDPTDHERTVSKHTRWNRMKYHFEKKM